MKKIFKLINDYNYKLFTSILLGICVIVLNYFFDTTFLNILSLLVYGSTVLTIIFGACVGIRNLWKDGDKAFVFIMVVYIVALISLITYLSTI